MNISMIFIRILFLITSIFFSISFAMQNFTEETALINVALGMLGGILLAGFLIGSDLALQRFNLRSFNTAVIGLFFGYLMGQAILSILTGILGSDVFITNYMPLRFLVFISPPILDWLRLLGLPEKFTCAFPLLNSSSRH